MGSVSIRGISIEVFTELLTLVNPLKPGNAIWGSVNDVCLTQQAWPMLSVTYLIN